MTQRTYDRIGTGACWASCLVFWGLVALLVWGL